MSLRLSQLLAPAWGLVWLAAPLGAAEGACLHIGLKGQVQVPPGRVRLGDVASLEAADVSLLERVSRLEIGQAPLGESPSSISRARLEAFLQRKLGRQVGLRWSGASAVLVQTASQRVTEAELFAVAESAVTADLRSRGLQGRVRLQVPIPGFRVPVGDKACRVRSRVLPRTPGGAPSSVRQTVWVDVWVGERLCRTVAVGLRVEGVSEGPATEQRVAQLPALEPAEPLPAMERSRPSRGSNLVSRGSQAVLRTQDGVISLESKVLVLEDGLLGQRVRVKLPSGTSSIEALVTGPGQVEVKP